MSIYPGMQVEDATGTIGVVQEIVDSDRPGSYFLVVRSGRGELFTLAPETYARQGDVIRVTSLSQREINGATASPYQTQQIIPPAASLAQTARELQPGEELRIPVVREEVNIRPEVVERGGVRIQKTIQEREEVVEQPLVREHVNVERVAVGRIVDVVPQVREEGNVLVIPVLEEMLVVEKRLVLKEEIRITRERTQETEPVRVVVQAEHVDVERIDDGTAPRM